jgi:hypothetical protein
MNLETMKEEDLRDSSSLSHQSIKNTNILSDALLTRKQVAQILHITEHCLTTNTEKWKHVLPRIKMEGSNIIRYRKSDVVRLIEMGQCPATQPKEAGIHP